MSTDATLDHRLAAAFGDEPPPAVFEALDQRLADAIERARAVAGSHGAYRRRRLTRNRAIAAVAVAAVLVGTAASPTVREAFDRWAGGDFSSIWELATPIDQSVVDESYRVTLVRAYADPVGLYLALTMEDLEDRDVSEAHVGSATVSDADGVVYPPFIGGSDGTGSSAYSEGLWRYHVPVEAAVPGVRRLTAEVTGISVRANDPPDATDGFPFETLWTEIPGSWTFQFDLEFKGRLGAQPGVTASHAGIAVTWTDLVVTPSATIITLQVTGLEPTEEDWGWDQGGRIEHDGHRLEWFSSQGILDAGPEPQTIVYEMEQGRDDLSGTWTVTIDEFRTDVPDPNSDVTTETKIIRGPWVLTFDGPSAD